jgi:PEP-CTERM motif-containing protein
VTTGLPAGLGTTHELYLNVPGADAYAFQTAIGYPGFDTVSLPSTAEESFSLHLLDGSPDQILFPGETLPLGGVSTFELIGDPPDVTLGVSFATSDTTAIGPVYDTIFTANTTPAVPEPGTLILLASALLSFGVIRKR